LAEPLVAHPTKSVTFNNTLKTFTLSSTYNVNFFAFSENVNSDSIT
jgi:hypothetical protein